MATLSIVTGKCGGGSEGKDQGFESRSHLDFGKDFFGSYLFRTSSRGVNRNWSKAFEDSSIRSRNRFRVSAKVKRGKNHDYPWPDDIDPNFTGSYLAFLSHFKPLSEKPKPVTVPFEKSLVDLEQKIIEVRRMADETGLDFSDQIGSLERKYQQALKGLYTNLRPMQRLTIARHPNRPTVLNYIFNITEKWVELHGDCAGYDDPAIVTGIGSMDGKTYMFIGHQKGRNTKENIKRNFAMPTPHCYWKALRMMKYADHHDFPIVTFIDTPGAFADLKSEELGQGESIAHNLRTNLNSLFLFSALRPQTHTHTHTSLKMRCRNTKEEEAAPQQSRAEQHSTAAQQHSKSKKKKKIEKRRGRSSTDKETQQHRRRRRRRDAAAQQHRGAEKKKNYGQFREKKTHQRPEACAAILWKSSQAAPKAAERLKITAQEHYKLKIADGVIPEALGGAHTDPVWTSQQIKLAITDAMKELANMDKKELLNHRRLKFRSIGGVQEGIAVDPEKKRNMKPSDNNVPKTADMESELENLKKILEAGPSDHTNIDLIEKLKQDVNQEIDRALISMGLQEKLEPIKSELSKAPNPTDQPPNRKLKEDMDAIMLEFKHKLSQPGAYLGLKYKLGS